MEILLGVLIDEDGNTKDYNKHCGEKCNSGNCADKCNPGNCAGNNCVPNACS